ncbi:MAG: GntR family transcriptional regulator [Chloroflexota bacterium]|nr:GntR family transcriptional regulator [Chloroflexota bacterium]
MDLRHQTLVDRIYARLRALIEGGTIRSGARLDERALAEQMAVSRTPLREAIGKLTKEGLVEHRPYKGNFVRVLSAKQIDDLYEVRRALEGLAVRQSVPHFTSADTAEVREALEDTERALAAGDMAEYGAADQRFHDVFVRVAGNEALSETLDRLRMQVHLIRMVANRDPDIVARTAMERPRILAALEARDADLAARLMEEHIEGVRRSFHVSSDAHGDEASAGNDRDEAVAAS